MAEPGRPLPAGEYWFEDLAAPSQFRVMKQDGTVVQEGGTTLPARCRTSGRRRYRK